MHEPLVSIVINNINCEKYLSAAIDSALAQTYPNIEVLVTDDGSTEEYQAVIKKFGSVIRAIKQSRQGAAAAYNASFAASSGSIILFLDADDVLFPAAVRQIMEAWEEGTVKVQCRLELIDDAGASKGIAFPAYPKNYTPQALYRDFLARADYPWPAASGNAYDRGFLAKVLPLSIETFPSAPEGAINIVAPLFGKIISLPRPLVCYRVPGSVQRASANAVSARFTNQIKQKEREMAFLRHCAENMGVRLREGDLLNRSQAYVESRLCAQKLAAADAGTKSEPILNLCSLALRNVLTSNETPARRISSLLFCIVLACSNGKFASWLIGLRYDPASCPAIMADILKAFRLKRNRFPA